MATLENHWRQMTVSLRRLTRFISGLALVVGPLLFLLPDRTDTLFAWTINPPLTAAFMGGAYLTALVIETLAARQRVWAWSRVVYPAMLGFTSLTLLATLLHLDRFHFNSPDFTARFTAWAWLIIYIAAPLAMLVLIVRQNRQPGDDPPSRTPLPRWYRAALSLQAGIMVIVGLALFVAPSLTIPMWFWTLTPLTSQIVGAWIGGLGLAVGGAALENDWERIAIAVAGNWVIGVLELAVAVRFNGQIQWTMPGAWLYVIFLLSMVGLGLYGWRAVRLRR